MKTDLLDRIIVTKILSPKYIKINILGAPFRIGQKVTIKNPNNGDDTFEKKFIGQIGTIVFFEYNCGCGQTFPNDPMVGVEFSRGEQCEFWKEEITIL